MKGWNNKFYSWVTSGCLTFTQTTFVLHLQRAPLVSPGPCACSSLQLHANVIVNINSINGCYSGNPSKSSKKGSTPSLAHHDCSLVSGHSHRLLPRHLPLSLDSTISPRTGVLDPVQSSQSSVPTNHRHRHAWHRANHRNGFLVPKAIHAAHQVQGLVPHHR